MRKPYFVLLSNKSSSNDDDDDDHDDDDNNNNNNSRFPESRKYWVNVQRGIVSSHGERDPL